jgi:[ribosomal protein S5]-alanine N-acetyltransferase
MSEIINAPRLSLQTLSYEQLEKCLNAIETLEEELGFALSRNNIDANVIRAIGLKLGKMAAVPRTDHSWYTFWLIVTKEAPFGAGMIGFKGTPDAHGRVEVGYGIDEAWRNRGYVTEALKAIMSWAFGQPGCEAITATAVSNHASEKVLQKVGFRNVGGEGAKSSWEFLKHEWENNGRFQA